MYIDKKKTATIGVAIVSTAAAVGGITYFATQGEPRMDEDGVRSFNSQEFTETVDYYRAVCPHIGSMKDTNAIVSVSLEESIGAEDPVAVRIDGLRNASATVQTAVDGLSSVTAPTEIPSSGDPVDYTGAVDELVTVGKQYVIDLNGLVTALEAGDVASVDDRQSTVLEEGGRGVSRASNTLVRKAPLTNEKTAGIVQDLPECSALFGDGPVPQDDQVIDAAADLHSRLNEASRLSSEGTDALMNLPDMSETPMTESVITLSAAWESRAVGSEKAASVVEEWVMPANPDPVTAHALNNYPAIASDTASAYRNSAVQARAVVSYLAGVNENSDPDEVSEFLRQASDDAVELMEKEAKLRLRASREAPLPNAATAEKVTGQE